MRACSRPPPVQRQGTGRDVLREIRCGAVGQPIAPQPEPSPRPRIAMTGPRNLQPLQPAQRSRGDHRPLPARGRLRPATSNRPMTIGLSGADSPHVGGGTTNVRNTASSHWMPHPGTASRCLVPCTPFSEPSRDEEGSVSRTFFSLGAASLILSARPGAPFSSSHCSARAAGGPGRLWARG